jgi:hypothetical protein
MGINRKLNRKSDIVTKKNDKKIIKKIAKEDIEEGFDFKQGVVDTIVASQGVIAKSNQVQSFVGNIVKAVSEQMTTEKNDEVMRILSEKVDTLKAIKTKLLRETGTLDVTTQMLSEHKNIIDNNDDTTLVEPLELYFTMQESMIIVSDLIDDVNITISKDIDSEVA